MVPANGSFREESTLLNPEWDHLLQSHPLGQFQQSSLWAQVKATEGWTVHRGLQLRDLAPVGGWQMLYRSTRFGRIGYVSKGPVPDPSAPEDLAPSLSSLLHTARRLRLRALIVHPPDDCTTHNTTFTTLGLVPEHCLGIAQTTLIIDLTAPIDWRTNLQPNTRRAIRKSQERGVIVREGTPSDAPVFFKLMAASASRQKVAPNPRTQRAVEQLLQSFLSNGAGRLFLADFQSKTLSALFLISFGRIASEWKKGWSGAHPEARSNELLCAHAIDWASQHQCHRYDTISISPDTADCVLRGEKPSQGTHPSSDLFKLSFGGRPKFLPPPWIWFRHPPLRWLYRALAAQPALRRAIKRQFAF